MPYPEFFKSCCAWACLGAATLGCTSSNEEQAVERGGAAPVAGRAGGDGGTGSGGPPSNGGASAGSPQATSGGGGTEATSGESGSSPGNGGSSGRAAGGNGGDGGGGRQPGAGGADGASPSPACPAGVLMCEGFETYTPLVALNGRFVSRAHPSSKATVVVDSLQAHSGTKAVHFYGASIDNTQKNYILTQTAPFPVAADRLFVRFMLYIKRFMFVSGTAMHSRIAWVGPADVLLSGGNGAGYSLATFNGLAIERILDPNKGWQRDTTQKLEDESRRNRWQCFEFELDNKGGVPNGEKAGSTMVPHIWQEGKELPLAAAGTADVWAAVRFDALQFSLWSQQADPMPTEYWIDDIVVATERINCPE